MIEKVIKLTDESKLIRALKQRKDHAFDEVFTKYSKSLRNAVKEYVREHFLDDLIQDTFIKVWKCIDNYDPEKGRFYTWLVNVTKNNAIDLRRSKEYKKALMLQELDINIYSESLHMPGLNVDLIGFRKVIMDLNLKHYTILDLVYFKGFTLPEVSEELNLKLGTVKTRLRQTLIELRAYFKADKEKSENKSFSKRSDRNTNETQLNHNRLVDSEIGDDIKVSLNKKLRVVIQNSDLKLNYCSPMMGVNQATCYAYLRILRRSQTSEMNIEEERLKLAREVKMLIDNGTKSIGDIASILNIV
ncbi:RNA polymerase sigma factor [Pedobacter nutrimenti]|uniref:RNA polymerase sigma factor (Sigma-70 family) n=1 Tax=Pedobacter nutrimenti TaxID=1241337 RepID=A0A318U7G1_9SPHI|nr:sigma-70 family RNA polymerase sigma factor [Pedobacter nutrimenti]PYF68472.1 RNA polymerase sigma factor (sigma-70 family) [Pedobacter nutrimenti]